MNLDAVLQPSIEARHGWRAVAPARIAVFAGLWFATLGNIPLWRALHGLGLLRGVQGAVLAAGVAALVAAVTAALLAALAWRPIFKPALIALLLAGAAATHFTLAYNVIVDPGMIANVLQTDWREAADLLDPWLVVALVLLGALPAAWVWRTPVAWRSGLSQAWRNLLLLAASLALLAAALLASFQPLSSAVRNHKPLRYLVNPVNTLYALGAHAAAPLKRAGGPPRPIGEDVRRGASYAAQAKPPLVLLVLGETGRAGNFGLNGYARDTTPELARIAELASLRDAWSCGTSTAASVPCMFSRLGRKGFDERAADEENLLDVIQRAGLAVLWLDNQSGCKGVCDRVPHASTARETDPALCGGGECRDMILLKGLDARIAALPAERRASGTVVVLHTMGSHGPAYFKRSPPAFKRFLPECTSNQLADCSRDEVANAYDNSMAYADHVLASAIAWLKAREATHDTALVYVSDHGESLGENNLYLHGLPYAIAPDVQKRVPWIEWLSPGYERRSGVRASCLQGRRDTTVSHDHYFHSLLGLLDLTTSVYRRELDLHAGCAGAG